MTVMRVGADTAIVDLLHQGQPSVIGTGVLRSVQGGIGLVDPGPEACLARLRAGLKDLGYALTDVRAVFLTHIHLDHAAATGAILREAPGALVYVHPRGAPHMVEPGRLLASARRLYGDAMGRLWGNVLPVPLESVREVDEGDVLTLGDRRFKVAYVPGHAKHHVAYYEAGTGTAWVGDVGGIRIRSGPVIPVTPPPDIDVEAWNRSMDRVLAWRPERIVPTHFGPSGDPGAHFGELRDRLAAWSDKVRRSLGTGSGEGPSESDGERAGEFGEWVKRGLAAELSPERVARYAFASGFQDSWRGLARYWRKQGSAISPRGG